MPASYETHRRQLELILHAWGMAQPAAASTAEIMSWADLHGIDTHGISMVPVYDERRRGGKIDMKAEPVVSRETPVSALVDGQGGLGHANARRAMDLAIAKAKTSGIGVAVVRNSAHFGACGFYALMAVEAGLIGMVATSASGIQVAPTFGAQARLGTDPIAFGAPGRPGEPFLLDMATTTVAAGKIRNKANENLPTPLGWLVTAEGKPSTDPREVSKGGFMTPLGGTPDGSSHKGYGLSSMVNILSSALSGATMITDPLHTKKPGTQDIGHFMLALDPGMFRDPEEFRADVADLLRHAAHHQARRSRSPRDGGGRPRAAHRCPAPQDRHSGRTQPARQGARGRARVGRAVDHDQLNGQPIRPHARPAPCAGLFASAKGRRQGRPGRRASGSRHGWRRRACRPKHPP